MKECSNALREAGKEYPKMCSICGFGDCKYPRNYPEDFIEGAFGIYPRPKPPSGGPSVQQPPLSRAELADFRARAFEAAFKIHTSSYDVSSKDIVRIADSADEILAYILNGKQP